MVDGAESVEVVTSPANFEPVRDALASRGFAFVAAEIEMRPSTTVKLEGRDAERMLSLADALEELDDVQSVSANFDISDEEMARLS